MPEVFAAHLCPKCSSDDVERVPGQGAINRMKRLFGWRLYRCRDCRVRFYDRPSERKVW